MKSAPRPSRTPSDLPSSLQRRLSAYTFVAGATGASLLALAPPSEAEIVYTPANEVIGRDGSYALDLNHDGIIDFTIAEHADKIPIETFQTLVAKAGPGNRVNCPSTFCISSFVYAAAFTRGTEIGPNQRRHGWLGYNVDMAFEALDHGGSIYYADGWVNVSDRYLGLKFKINGETHFGWARLTVRFLDGPLNERTWEAHLTGYAYETVAGKSIKAGQTVDNAKDSPGASLRLKPDGPAQFAALGTLALGADGIALWRRE